MSEQFQFDCNVCKQTHEGSPRFSFPHPAYVNHVPEADRAKLVELDSEHCIIHAEQGDLFFIRAVVEVPIHGFDAPFIWASWVNVSEENYRQFVSTLDAPNLTDRYFGWFATDLPFYDSTLSLKVHVTPRAGGKRPLVEMEVSGHEFEADHHNGISAEKAQMIAEKLLHP